VGASAVGMIRHHELRVMWLAALTGGVHIFGATALW